MGVTRFGVDAETAAFLTAVSRGGFSAIAAILTWATAAYLRKVSRGDAVVLAVPTTGGRWIPLRCDVALEAPAKDSLVRVRDALEELASRDAPDLMETAAALGLPHSDRDNGLCDTAVFLSGATPDAAFPPSIALGLRFELGGETGLGGELHWRSDCFDARDVEAIPGHLRALLGALAADVSRPLAGLCLLASGERSQLVEEPNRTRVDLEGPNTIPAAFARVAAENPDKVVVIAGNTEVRYRELAARADRVASALLEAGVRAGSRVGLMARRDEWLLPALLGILKAGCAYVPLDPEYPEQRLAWVLEDCGASAVLASTGVPLVVGAPRTLYLENLGEHSTKQWPCPDVSAEDAAYLIYTSGSTGKPKGVRITHGNVLNFFAGMDAVIPRSERDTWLAITSISFDISVLELLWTVCRGVRVVVQESGRLVDADAPSTRTTEATFSLFFFADCDAERAAAHYDLLLRSAEFADREGLEAIWVPERHFHRFGGLFPNPSLAAAALAARTRRIGIRAGSVVSPLHNPLRIAEEWSFVDNISGGRVGISFASGWNPRDFVLAPGGFAERREKLYRDLDFVRRFWRGEIMTLSAGDKDHDVELYPKPVQRELPVWITASDSLETFANAGAAGAHVLTHLLHHSFEALEQKIAAYRAAFRAHHQGGRAGKVTLMVHTFVGDSEQQVLDAVRGPFRRYLRSSAELMRAALPKALAGAEIDDADKEAIVDAAFERFFEERGLFGTPESCLAKVRRLERADVDEIACLVDFIPDTDLVYEHLRHLVALQALAKGSRKQLDVAGQIEAHQVTHFQCTPPLARALMESQRFRTSLRHLRVFAIGGEAFPSSLRDSIRECSDAVVLNMYGPTETTVWSTVQQVDTGCADVPLGRPLVNTQVYVLAPDLAPLPANRAGELCIGGKGVATGYWNRAELSTERFVPDPFSSDSRDRLYRTGDLVQWDHQGELRFLGRLDRQVKIRGHRIELGEIESRLRAHPRIREVAVASRKIGNSAHLCAYYSAETALDSQELKAHIRQALPAYMVPEYLIRLDEFPMTANRKLDLGALPAPDELASTSDVAALPSDPLVGKLLEIWKRVLGRASLGPHDDFFRSGGDSIQVIQVAAQANAAGFSLSPKLIYEHPTAASLASALASTASSPVAESLPEGNFELLPAQRWFFGMEVPARSHWNQSVLLGLRDDVGGEPLRSAISAAFARHPAFRLRFRRSGAGWLQSYAQSPGSALAYRSHVWDHASASSNDVGQAIRTQADLAHRSLDLEHGPVAAAVHLSGFPGGDLLLLTAHHLVVDGLSWRVLLEDVARAYDTSLAGIDAALPPAPGPHLLARLAAERAASPEGLIARDFWERKLASAPEPPWNDTRAWREDECELWTAPVCGPGERELLQMSGRLKADAEALTLAAFVRAFRVAGLGSGFTIDMETHGRGIASRDAAAAAVGWLTRIYPLVLPAGGDRAADVLRQVKNLLREAAPHKDFCDAPPGAPQRAPIIFNYLGQLEASVRGSRLFASFQLSPGQPRDPNALRHHTLEVNVHQTEHGLVWEFIYPPLLLPRETVSQLAVWCAESLQHLAELSEEAAADCLLPEDFPGVSLAPDEIRELSSQPGGLDDAYPATPHQRALFFQLHACPSDHGRFVHQAVLLLEGCADEARLERALQAVVVRHDAFRSAFFSSRAGALVQVVRRESVLSVRRMDWSDLSAAEQQRRLRTLQKLDLEHGVEPSRAPLIRAVLVRTEPESSVLLWTYHHLVADGWSLPLVMRDLRESYVTGQAPTAPVGHFGVFARWLARVNRDEHEAFWIHYLDRLKVPAPLSAAGRKSDFSYRVEYGVLEQQAGEEAMTRWERAARNEGVTFPALLQAAWGLALCRASRAGECVFGVTVAGRPAEVPDVEHAIGLFINTVPFRFHTSSGETSASIVRRVHRQGSTLREHAYVEPALLNRLMGLQGGQMPFETVLVLQNFASPDSSMDSPGLRVRVLDFLERNPTPLTLEVAPNNGLSIRYVFDSRHFQRPQVLDLHRELITALDELSGDPSAPVQPTHFSQETFMNGVS